MKQGKLVKQGPSAPSKSEPVPEFTAVYENGQKLQDAFEIIENSGVEDTVTVELRRDGGLRVEAMNPEHSTLSLLSLPPAAFAVLKGNGSATVELKLLMKVLEQARKNDGIKIGTAGRELSVNYTKSDRQLTIPLSNRKDGGDVPSPGIAWGATLKVQTSELQRTLRDLADLNAETLEVATTSNGVTISQSAEGVRYKKKFAKDNPCVESFDAPNGEKPIKAEYGLNQLESVVSRRFKHLTLYLGNNLPAKVRYSLDGMGSELTVIVAPAP